MGAQSVLAMARRGRARRIAHGARWLAWIAAFACSGPVLALGLGDIRTFSRLGEPLLAEIPLQLESGQFVQPECFRLIDPGQDLPWLKQGRFSLSGKTLRLRSTHAVQDPILQLAVVVGCGHDLRRDYTLMLPPPVQALAAAPAWQPEGEASAKAALAPSGRASSAGETPATLAARLYPHGSHAEQRRFARAFIRANRHLGLRPERGVHQSLPAGQEWVLPEWPPALPRPALSGARQAEPALAAPVRKAADAPLAADAVAGGDRLVLGLAVSGEAPALVLRLAPELAAPPSEMDTAGSELEHMRKLLRLEYRMLALLENHAEIANLPAAERLRALEAVLGEAAPSAPVAAAPKTIAPPAPVAKPTPPQVERSDAGAPAWPWLLAGAALLAGGVGFWLYWRRRRAAEVLAEVDESVLPPTRFDSVAASSDPFDEFDQPSPPPRLAGQGVFAAVQPGAAPAQSLLDDQPVAAPQIEARIGDIEPRVGPQPETRSDTSLDEAFSHNPVMELAEIMLSFGRVKGAAQALQEYIDQNPKEALQPWVKLLDIYRQAGMRAEFENLAKSLNQHFNVELLKWDDVPKPGEPGDSGFVLELVPLHAEPGGAPRPQSIEALPHICERIQALWGTEACYRYIQELLRDNRGGTRQGFPLSVVDELLFLSELLLQEEYKAPLAPDIDLGAETL